MGDDNELEVRLMLSGFDDLVKTFRKGSDVVLIKVGCGFIESNNLGPLLA